MLGGWKFSNIKDGMFSELFHVNEADANLCLIPPGISVEEAAMISDMIPTGFLGAEMADVQLGETVCVIGIGPVGLMAVAGANLKGASHLYAVGSRVDCAKVAKGYGATEIINYKNGSIVDQVLKLTDGKGVDKVILAGGDENTMIDAVKIVKAGGIVANINYFGSGDIIPLPRAEWGVGMGHKFIHGGLMISGKFRLNKYANLITTGKLDVKPLLTHKFNGFEKVEDALLLMKDKPADLIKPVVIL
jgi:alcohol dehydrogenase (NADP+)